jgi:hypothetical protein
MIKCTVRPGFLLRVPTENSPSPGSATYGLCQTSDQICDRRSAFQPDIAEAISLLYYYHGRRLSAANPRQSFDRKGRIRSRKVIKARKAQHQRPADMIRIDAVQSFRR